MKKTLIILTVFMTALLTMKGQDVRITAAFDTNAIYIGDQTHYNITMIRPSDLKLSLKPLKDTLVKSIEIISGPVGDSAVLPGNLTKITKRYLVTSFDSGFYQVPPVYAELKDPKGMKRYYSDYSPIRVMRVNITPPDTVSKIFDIVGPYRAPLTIGEMLPWIITAFIAAAIVWGIITLLKRRRRKNGHEEPVKNPDPAHVIAFRELGKLRQEELWQKGEIKQYYSRLTEILRQYLENRYAVFSLEMTTSETLEALLRTGFRKDESYNILKTVLNGADLVKFAKYKPVPEENDDHFSNAWRFVENTRAAEEIPSSANEGGKEVQS